jgi:hypothetical protein
MDINKLLDMVSTVNRWKLDNIVYHDRTTNPQTLVQLLKRIKFLKENGTETDAKELEILEDLAKELDEDECIELLTPDEDDQRMQFIEELARKGAIETLCDNKINVETMELLCKLSPNDFILTAKRSQDIINTVKELVVQGETLSQDVAGA